MQNNKPVKVWWNGKRLRDMYPHATAWQVLKWRIKKLFRKIFILAALGIAGAITVLAIREAYPKIEYKAQITEVMIDNLTPKIDQLKGELLKDMWDNERAGHDEDDALISWDPNPNHKSVEIASVGTCQWKIPTMQESYLKHYGKQLTRKEAILVALDDNKCKELMATVIFTEENGWQKWYNSGVKYNAKSRLAIIKQLEN